MEGEFGWRQASGGRVAEVGAGHHRQRRRGDDGRELRLLDIDVLEPEQQLGAAPAGRPESVDRIEGRGCGFGHVPRVGETNGGLHAFVADPVGEVARGAVGPWAWQRDLGKRDAAVDIIGGALESVRAGVERGATVADQGCVTFLISRGEGDGVVALPRRPVGFIRAVIRGTRKAHRLRQVGGGVGKRLAALAADQPLGRLVRLVGSPSAGPITLPLSRSLGPIHPRIKGADRRRRAGQLAGRSAAGVRSGRLLKMG